LAQVDDPLEKALEDLYPQPLPDAGEAGVVGEGLVEGVAEVPSVGQVEAGRFDQLALGADAFEEHDQLQLEEDDRIDGGAAPLGVVLPRPVADEAEVQLGFEVAVEVIGRDEGLERDGDRLIKATWLGRAEHRRSPGVEAAMMAPSSQARDPRACRPKGECPWRPSSSSPAPGSAGGAGGG
jgi:hypothetical protein